MMPAVRAPRNAAIRIPVEVKLKPRYRYDSEKTCLRDPASGARFKPGNDLPGKTRIVYKVPALAGMDAAKLSKWERDLQRHMQVILPEGASPQDYVDIIRAWPSVEEAWVAPEVSLPKVG